MVVVAFALIAFVDSNRTVGFRFPSLFSLSDRIADENGVAPSRNVERDAGITANIRLALANDPNLSGLGIRVATQEGRVALLGTAPNPVFKARAGLLAEVVVGVVSVDNQLVVRGPWPG